MPRRRTGRKRGRPRLARARRRETTLAGRRGHFAEPDLGTTELRRRKLRATGRVDLELSPAAVLLARGYLNSQQFDQLAQVTLWLDRLARSLGPKTLGVTGLWSALTGAMIGSVGVTVPNAVGTGADNASYRLGRMLAKLDGSKALVVALAEGHCPPLVDHIIEGRLTGEDAKALEQLRSGLDALAGRR